MVNNIKLIKIVLIMNWLKLVVFDLMWMVFSVLLKLLLMVLLKLCISRLYCFCCLSVDVIVECILLVENLLLSIFKVYFWVFEMYWLKLVSILCEWFVSDGFSVVIFNIFLCWFVLWFIVVVKVLYLFFVMVVLNKWFIFRKLICNWLLILISWELMFWICFSFWLVLVKKE